MSDLWQFVGKVSAALVIVCVVLVIGLWTFGRTPDCTEQSERQPPE